MADRTINHNAEVKAIRDYIDALGGWTTKLAGGAYQRPGLPDIAGHLRSGEAIYVEVKTGAGHLSGLQDEVRYEIETSGGLFILAATVFDVQAELVRRGLAPADAIQGRRSS